MPAQPSPTPSSEALDALFAISQLLNTGLDRQALAHCIALVEGGVDPEALATAVQELRDEQRRLASSSSAGR